MQVREAAVEAVNALLARLPFSKSYYAVVEEMLMQLARDPSHAIHAALTMTLLPVIQVRGGGAERSVRGAGHTGA